MIHSYFNHYLKATVENKTSSDKTRNYIPADIHEGRKSLNPPSFVRVLDNRGCEKGKV